jgi:hypothetical protein
MEVFVQLAHPKKKKCHVVRNFIRAKCPAPIINVPEYPAPIIHVPEYPAPVINVPAPIVNVPAPIINVPEYPAPIIHVPAPIVNVPEYPAPIINVPAYPPAENILNIAPAPVTVLPIQDHSVVALEEALLPFINQAFGVEIFTALSQGSRIGILREIRPGGVIVIEPRNAMDGERLFFSLSQVIGFHVPAGEGSRPTDPMIQLLTSLINTTVTIETDAGTVNGLLQLVGIDVIQILEASGNIVLIPITSITAILQN